MSFDLKKHIEEVENNLDGIWVNLSKNSYLKFLRPHFTGTKGGLLFSSDATFISHEENIFIVEFNEETNKTFILVQTHESKKILGKYLIDFYQGQIRQLDLIKGER
jgi:hypothetical protein